MRWSTAIPATPAATHLRMDASLADARCTEARKLLAWGTPAGVDADLKSVEGWVLSVEGGLSLREWKRWGWVRQRSGVLLHDAMHGDG